MTHSDLKWHSARAASTAGNGFTGYDLGKKMTNVTAKLCQLPPFLGKGAPQFYLGNQDLPQRERGRPKLLKITPMQPASNSPNLPLYYQDATALAALIRTKQVTPREVVQAHLDRISAVNPALNALVTLLADEALQAADAAGPSGPCTACPSRRRIPSTLRRYSRSAARPSFVAAPPKWTRPAWRG